MGAGHPKEENKGKGKDEDKKQYPIIKQKVEVDITPWDNIKRSEDPPTEKVQSDELFESTVFDIGIKLIEVEINNKEEEAEYNNLKDFVLMKKEGVTTQVKKHDDYIVKLRFPLRLTRNMVKYIFHQKTEERGWYEDSITEKQDGSRFAEIEKKDLSLKSIFVTSQRIYDEVSLSSDEEHEYKDGVLKDEKVVFPKGSVKGNANIKISTLSVSATCKKERIAKELGDDPAINSLSNVLYVDHDQKFRNTVVITLKMDILFEEKEMSNVFAIHCDADGVHISNRPVKCISESEGLYSIEVDRFSGWLIGSGDGNSIESCTSGLNKALDIGKLKCQIVIFLLKGKNSISLLSEIVKAETEDDVETAVKKRKDKIKDTEEKLYVIELLSCRSQIIKLKNFSRIRVSIPPNVGIKVPPKAGKKYQFIYYDRDSYENCMNMPIETNERFHHELAIVEYSADKFERTLCHQAHFPAYEYALSVPKPLYVIHTTKNPARDEKKIKNATKVDSGTSSDQTTSESSSVNTGSCRSFEITEKKGNTSAQVVSDTSTQESSSVNADSFPSIDNFRK